MKNKKPNTLFICCCDNRVIPYSFTSKKQGDLFVLRNIGNLIPPYQASDISAAAAIEYALEHLAIPQIIVCGHSDCGAMKAVLTGVENGSSLSNWIKYAVPTNNITSPADLSRANVLHQIKNLMTYPAVAKRLSQATLAVNGWWLDLDADAVYCYDEQTSDWTTKNSD